jgi:hypothetical protein
MSHDVISSWVEKAKSLEVPVEQMDQGIQVIRCVDTNSRGNVIMDIAEKLRPFLMKMFEGMRDDEGMLVQPASVRGIALNVAQELVKRQEQKANA